MAGKDESTVLAVGGFLVGMLGMDGLMVLGVKELWALGLVWVVSLILVYSLQQTVVGQFHSKVVRQLQVTAP